MALALFISGNVLQAQTNKKVETGKGKKATTKKVVKPAKKTSINYKTTKNGLGYYFFTENKKLPLPVAGDQVNVHFTIKTDNGNELNSTYKMGQTVPVQLGPTTVYADPIEGIGMMHEGDSAVFRMLTDSVFKTLPEIPEPAKGSKYMYMYVKAYSITKEKDIIREPEVVDAPITEGNKNNQMAMDEELIQNYLKEKSLTSQVTPTGLHYVMTNQGNGEKPKKGSTVSVHYKGTLLNGKKFDSSYDRDKPLEFQLGTGMVITGWDEGIALLSRGGKATLLIPSALAYGRQAMGNDIPANSVLLFEVELVDFK